jgi:hypothetical protein
MLPGLALVFSSARSSASASTFSRLEKLRVIWSAAAHTSDSTRNELRGVCLHPCCESKYFEVAARQCKCTSLCCSSRGTAERAGVQRRRRLLVYSVAGSMVYSGCDRDGRACDDARMRLVQSERCHRPLLDRHGNDYDLHIAHKITSIDSVQVQGSSLKEVARSLGAALQSLWSGGPNKNFPGKWA